MQHTKKVRKPVDLDEAQALIRTRTARLAPRELALREALCSTVAEDIIAEMDQPPFPRSPYDGYALRAAESAGASEEMPAALKLVGLSVAGSPAHASVGAGQAVRVMTGGMIPDGADCVVPQEQTREADGVLYLLRSLQPGENYCHKGEDYSAGELLLAKGTPVTAAAAAVVASAGLEALPCIPVPRVAVLSTGDELKRPAQALGPGQIYDSNRVFLSARLVELHAMPVSATSAGDNLPTLQERMLQALGGADMLVTTGGVSVGMRDLVPDALQALGAELVFHGVRMKPGMPALFALLGGKPVLALSGNPFAAAASFEMLARTALAALAGNGAFLPRTATAVLRDAFHKKSPQRRFLRGTLENGAVTLPPSQGNGQLRTMVGCNCLAEIPAGSGGLEAGAQVKVHLL